jgi:hypothetical protein
MDGWMRECIYTVRGREAIFRSVNLQKWKRMEEMKKKVCTSQSLFGWTMRMLTERIQPQLQMGTATSRIHLLTHPSATDTRSAHLVHRYSCLCTMMIFVSSSFQSAARRTNHTRSSTLFPIKAPPRPTSRLEAAPQRQPLV